VPITFERVATVAVGDHVSAANLANLARSINQRLLSGLGDGPYRLIIYWLAALRQIRNPDISGTLFPAQAEALTSYQGLSADFSWPDAAPGEAEGINVNSFVGSYVFGTSSANIYDESTRLAVDGIPMGSASSPSAAWELGKRQRGAYDPETRGMGSPAVSAAISYGQLTRGRFSVHGNSYGGFFPIPDAAGATCADGSESLVIKFTSLKGAGTKTYSGTCDETAGDVVAVYRMPLGYYVLKSGGAVEYLPRSDWLEGPYTRGEHPMHAWGDHWPRVMAQFSAQFRGTSAQRQDELDGKPWLGNAFDIAHFLTRPYYLAPARGVEVGSDIFPQYPSGTSSAAANQTLASGTQIGGTVRTTDGFGIVAVYVEASGLSGSATVAFSNGKTGLGSVTVSSASPSAILTLAEAQHGSEITAKLSGAASFSFAGSINVEWAELMDQKPGLNDLFVALRLMGCKTPDALGTDGSGLAEDKAKALWESYAANGCFSTDADHGELTTNSTIGENAVYDTLRRMSRNVRVLTRDNFVAYAVEDGNSVLWLTPNYKAVPRANGTDALEGITDAIATDAPPRGYSNEWCGFVNSHPYHVSESSLWKPSAFSDYFPIIDRCMFYSSAINGPTNEMKRFAMYGSVDAATMISPEVASGHRYAKSGNQEAVSKPSFYKSCRIYEPPLAVKKAESQTDGTVKITFDGRFHYHDSAPASIGRDVAGWDLVALKAEADDYRTEENAIREYLAHAMGSGSYQCSAVGWGNDYSARIADALTDNPFGSCYPTLFLVKLLPKPYLDGNDRQDAKDTPFESEVMRTAELYLRVMSEGYVDKQTSEGVGCDSASTFDFRYEQLCYQATGMPWLIPIGDTGSKYLAANEVREDRPEGFGPMPTTRAAASVFNGFANAVNLLNRVRVSLPWQLEVDASGTANTTTTAPGMYRSDGAALDCSTYTSGGLLWRGAQPDLSPGAYTGVWTPQSYADSVLDTVVATAGGGGSYACSGSLFELYSTRRDTKYRFDYIDSDALNAIPEAWRTQLGTDAEFLATQETLRRKVSWATVTAGTGEPCGVSDGWQTGGGAALAITYTDESEVVCQKFATSNTISAPAQPVINLAASAYFGGLCESTGGYSSGQVARTMTPVDTATLVLPITLTDPDLTS